MSLHTSQNSVQSTLQPHGLQHARPPCPSTNSWSLLKLMSIKLVMPAKPSHPLSSPSPPAFSPSQHQGLFKGAVLPIRWPKYWSCSFSISPSNEYSGLISFRIDWLNLLPVQGILKFNTTVQKHQFLKHQFFSTQLS